MRFVGLDVHKRIIQAHFCDQQGHKLQTMRFDLNTASLQGFALQHLGSDCAVALEATTNTWAVVDILAPHCAQITVGNPLRTKAIALSKHKSDRVDAESLAQLLRCGYLPKVWIADAYTREERNLAARRSALVRQGALIKNRIHSILHQHLIQTPFDPFTQQGRQWLVAERGHVITPCIPDMLQRCFPLMRRGPAASRRTVSQIAYPDLVRRSRSEVLVQQIGRHVLQKVWLDRRLACRNARTRPAIQRRN